MTVKVSDHLYRKSTMRDLSGNIINLIDETNGGYIIRNRQVVNQERWDEIVKIERDKIEAAKAVTHQVSSPHAEQRNGTPAQVKAQPDKLEALEKRIDSQDAKLDAILKALQSK